MKYQRNMEERIKSLNKVLQILHCRFCKNRRDPTGKCCSLQCKIIHEALLRMGTYFEFQKITNDWRNSMTQENREKMVERFVKMICPISDPRALRDQRMQNVILYSQQYESEIFEKSKSCFEYFYSYVKKIEEIKADLDIKRQLRRTGLEKFKKQTKEAKSRLVPHERANNCTRQHKAVSMDVTKLGRRVC